MNNRYAEFMVIAKLKSYCEFDRKAQPMHGPAPSRGED